MGITGPPRNWKLHRVDCTLGLAGRRISGRYIAILAWTSSVGCASAHNSAPAEQRGLAPSGTLRVALNLANAVTVTRNDTTGELRGVAVELGRNLARRLGVPFTPVTYPSAGKMVEAATMGEWDVAFLAVDPARAVDIAFAPPYMEVDNTYLVPPGSALRSIADIDRPGIRIAVPHRSAPDLFLSRTLRHAELVRTEDGLAATVEVVREGRAHALAADRSSLLGVAATWPGARVLSEPFIAVGHAIAIPRSRVAELSYLRDFVEEAKRSGLIRQAIERSGVRGVRVAACTSALPR